MFDPGNPLRTVICGFICGHLLTLPPFFKQERKSATHRCAKRAWAVDRQHPSSVQRRWVLLLWLPLPLNCNANQNTHTQICLFCQSNSDPLEQLVDSHLTVAEHLRCKGRGGLAVCSLGSSCPCRKTTFLTVKPLAFQSKIKKKKKFHAP